MIYDSLPTGEGVRYVGSSWARRVQLVVAGGLMTTMRPLYMPMLQL